MEQLVSAGDMQEERFRSNAAARERWVQTALARAVAITVIQYRAERGLSQRDLGKQVGLTRSSVARLELGEHNPTVEMLQRLAQGLGVCFVVAVAPAGRADELELPASMQVLVDVRGADGSRVLAGMS